jgi:hypothetical protein
VNFEFCLKTKVVVMIQWKEEVSAMRVIEVVSDVVD